MKILKYITLALFLSASTYAQDGLIWKLDFKSTAYGPLLNYKLTKEGGPMEYISLANNSVIVEDEEHPHALRVRYPEGAVGPSTIGHSGSQFIKAIPEAEDYYLDYYIMFEEGFDFQKGGKLPGLTSGGSKFTGGEHPDNGEGWSARYMWVDNGRMVVYLYYVDMAGQWGESVELGMNFVPGKWYRLTQRIKLNDVYTEGNGNGILQVWVDGEMVIDKDDFRFRFEGKGLIDSFYFSTFFGGATWDWAPDVDSYTRFDLMRVTTEKPNFDNLSMPKEELGQMNIYPNPVVNGEFTVVTTGMNNSIELSIFNVSGKQVYSQTLKPSGNKVIVNANLDSGLYIVKAYDGNTLRTQKITIK
ncbi:MAG: T9SS type A sorting domain-containing protein [Flavobacteriales bacterium]|nr:T9SS type A sorting domain-containing protein [Flavobacteriales bacterium]